MMISPIKKNQAQCVSSITMVRVGERVVAELGGQLLALTFFWTVFSHFNKTKKNILGLLHSGTPKQFLNYIKQAQESPEGLRESCDRFSGEWRKVIKELK